jgi:hypothetical protein
MSKLNSFVRLDFVTIKPYMTAKNLLIYAAVALFLTATSGSVASTATIAIMLGTMFISYPFALGEKSGMDTLYTTLSLDRKTVVSGRYLFALALNLCVFVFAIVFGLIGVFTNSFIAETSGVTGFSDELFITSGVIVVLLFFTQSLQLPLYFKLGYSKAKFLSIIPFVMLMAGFMALSAFGRGRTLTSRVMDFLSSLNVAWLVVCVVLVLAVVVFVSYILSVAFYRKREF